MSHGLADVAELPLVEARELLRSGKLSGQAYLSACLEQVSARERDVRAFVDLQADAARAAAADDSNGRRRRLALFGVPAAVDEVCDVAGFRCRRGSPYYGTRVPDSDSAVVAALRAAGAIVLGTTVTGELGMAGHGPTRNPFDVVRTAGGVASGGAAAVAAGMAKLALSVESGGAMLRAAAYCGVTGYRFTRGALDVRDVQVPVPFTAAPGLFARSVADLRLAATALAPDADVQESLAPVPLDAVSVCLVEGPMEPLIADACREARDAAVDAFARFGLPVERMRLSEWMTDALAILDVVAAYELAEVYGVVRDDRPDDLSDVLRARIDRGRRISAAAYEDAKREARRHGQQAVGHLDDRTVFLDAATLDVAPLRSRQPGSSACLAPWALAGMPAVVVPFGKAGPLPAAVQIVARPGQYGLALSVAEALAASR